MRTSILAVLAPLSLSAVAAGQARVIITEIMYNPNSAESRNETEWVEIANVGDAPIDIKDWRLDDEDKLDWSRFSCTLAPGAVAVLVNGDAVKEAQFREAWDLQAESAEAAPAPAYTIIPVKWGGLANNPSKQNEVLVLRNDKDEVVCEVNFEDGGDWPSFKAGDGPSIYLTDVTAANLNDGKLWARAEAGKDGGRANRKTALFTGNDIGSPGVVVKRSASTADPSARPASGAHERAVQTVVEDRPAQ